MCRKASQVPPLSLYLIERKAGGVAQLAAHLLTTLRSGRGNNGMMRTEILFCMYFSMVSI
jgi:hypothetical protein